MDEAFGEPAELAGVGKAEVERYCEELRALVLAETGLVASIGAGAGKQWPRSRRGSPSPTASPSCPRMSSNS